MTRAQMPLKYRSELAEHRAVREAAGLFDLSHMGEVWVTGPEAAPFLDYALVGKISAMAVGKAKYSLICNESGGHACMNAREQTKHALSRMTERQEGKRAVRIGETERIRNRCGRCREVAMRNPRALRLTG